MGVAALCAPTVLTQGTRENSLQRVPCEAVYLLSDAGLSLAHGVGHGLDEDDAICAMSDVDESTLVSLSCVWLTGNATFTTVLSSP